MFVSWASIYEGTSDETYFGALLPRVLNKILLANAQRPVDVADFPALKFGASGKSIEAVAREICEGAEAFNLLFSHADTGGRAQGYSANDRAMAYAVAAHELCGFDSSRCFPILPKKEMEAWALSDSDAVARALGFRGNPIDLELPTSPQDAERLADPKLTLSRALSKVKRRVRPSDSSRLLASIAQIQSLDALRDCQSYATFETTLTERMAAEGFFR